MPATDFVNGVDRNAFTDPVKRITILKYIKRQSSGLPERVIRNQIKKDILNGYLSVDFLKDFCKDYCPYRMGDLCISMSSLSDRDCIITSTIQDFTRLKDLKNATSYGRW